MLVTGQTFSGFYNLARESLKPKIHFQGNGSSTDTVDFRTPPQAVRHSVTIKDVGQILVEVFPLQDSKVSDCAVFIFGNPEQPNPDKPFVIQILKRCDTGQVFGSTGCTCSDERNTAIQEMQDIKRKGGIGFICFVDTQDEDRLGFTEGHDNKPIPDTDLTQIAHYFKTYLDALIQKGIQIKQVKLISPRDGERESLQNHLGQDMQIESQ